MEKMNRLFLWGLLIALIVGFAACSDDDNPEGGDGTGIVSKWRYEQPDGEYITEIRFNADGTFTEMEKEYYRSAGEWRTRNNEGTYVYDEEAEELTLYYTYYYDKESTHVEIVTVIELTSDILDVDYESMGRVVYKRI